MWCVRRVLMYCGQDVSPDDTGETVYARSSRNRLQTKIFIFLGMMFICTMYPWQMLVGDWVCLSDPRFLYGPPRYMYVGYGRYSLLTSHHVLRRILELHQVYESIPNLMFQKNILYMNKWKVFGLIPFWATNFCWNNSMQSNSISRFSFFDKIFFLSDNFQLVHQLFIG